MKPNQNLNHLECAKASVKYHRISVAVFILTQIIFFAFGLIVASNHFDLKSKVLAGIPLFILGLTGAYFRFEFLQLGREYNNMAFWKMVNDEG